MATDVKLYKTEACLDAYSRSGAFTDPVFMYPIYYFRGNTGHVRDKQLFLKNVGDTYLISTESSPFEVFTLQF